MTATLSSSRIRWWARVCAWMGGAVFVLALAFGAYFFVVVLRPVEASDGAAPVGRAVVVNCGLFALFAAHHSAMARTRAKRWLARYVPPPLERPLYVCVAGALFVGMGIAWQPLPGEAWTMAGAWRWAAQGLQLAGLLLVVLGARVLDPLDLAGVRQAISPPPTAHDAAAQPDRAPAARDDGTATHFTTAGPYGLVRHPIYLGTILLIAATPEMSSGRLLFTLLVIAYVVLAIPWEERSLARQHGEAYRRYRDAVRWRLVPGLY